MQGFNADQVQTVGSAAALAEELVSDAYKMSASQWKRHPYDVSTLARLDSGEVCDEHFAQIVLYKGGRRFLLHGEGGGLFSFDLYKVCLQDHVILGALERDSALGIFPFCLYIMCHELVHVVRFGRHLQAFFTSDSARLREEARVHRKTRDILARVPIAGLGPVLNYFGGHGLDAPARA